MKPLLHCLAPALLAALPAAQEILHHEIHVTLDPAAGRLEGDCTLTIARPVLPDERLILDLLDGEVHAVEIDGVPVEHYSYIGVPGLRERYDARSLVVTLPPGERGETLRLRIVYSDDSFYATATNPEDDLPFSLCQLDPELGSFSSHVAWYPWSTHKGQSADIHISAPAELEVITSGDLVGRTAAADGLRTWHYHSDHGSGLLAYPLAAARYDLLAAIAPDGHTRIELWHLPEDAVFARQKLAALEVVFEFFLQTFGPYPFSKLAVVETNLREGNIGLAAQSVVMLSKEVWFAAELDWEDTSLGNAALSVLADEVAHQWNAYAVASPNWLAEGISRYTDSLFMAHLGGAEVLVKHMHQTRASYFFLLESHRDLSLENPLIYPALYFVKGALALDLLRERLGPEAFDAGMRAYFALGAERPAELADFAAAFQRVSDRELGWFFEQWWERAGHPELEAELLSSEALPGGGFGARLRLTQTQEAPPYRLLLPLELRGEGERVHTARLEIRERQEEHTVQLPFEPTALILDPQERLPMEWR